MSKWLFILAIICISTIADAQLDSILARLSLEGDFRFRVEQDWNSMRSDGTLRTDRTRFRYRLRFGLNYRLNSWSDFGFRIRTGLPQKQQDPQLTLGDGFKEFGTLPLGFERVYFNAYGKGFKGWVGKNTFPFRKNNEQFWSDNVFPEGIFASKTFNLGSGLFNEIDIRAGHFLVAANGGSLSTDDYMQGVQLGVVALDERLTIFPSFYYFRQMPNIPDGGDTYSFDYSILNIGGKLQLTSKPILFLEFDYYLNLQDYAKNDSIPQSLRNQKEGVVVALTFGRLRKKGDWMTTATFNYQEQYSAVDFLAQNDWARWDYSSNGSLDGRLTNYRGLELTGGYMITDRIDLIVKYYHVTQIIPYGSAKETGDRIRFDINVRF